VRAVRRYSLKRTDERIVRHVVDDENLMLNQIVLPPGGEVPRHRANSNAYLLVIRGSIALELEDERGDWETGSIVNIPLGMQMRIYNTSEDVAEFVVIKVPNPRDVND
jgi:quercetin dioxygenase-like cupin family protein